MVLKTWPMKPSGVQFAMAMVPPGPADAQHLGRGAWSWSAVNMTPKVESTTSKLASGKLRASASSTRKSIACRSAAARARPRSSERGHVVGGGDLAEAAGGGEGGVAVAGGDVEHLRAGAQVDGLAEPLADDLERGADDGVVARGPGRLLLRLQRAEVDGRGGEFGHGSLPVQSPRTLHRGGALVLEDGAGISWGLSGRWAGQALDLQLRRVPARHRAVPTDERRRAGARRAAGLRPAPALRRELRRGRRPRPDAGRGLGRPLRLGGDAVDRGEVGAAGARRQRRGADLDRDGARPRLPLQGGGLGRGAGARRRRPPRPAGEEPEAPARSAPVDRGAAVRADRRRRRLPGARGRRCPTR